MYVSSSSSSSSNSSSNAYLNSRAVFGRSNVEITGSNPARGMDVCLRFSVLCCPV
jgi:hypothetical protein